MEVLKKTDKMGAPQIVTLILLYINLGRPQDIFTFLKALYIGKIFGLLTLICMLKFQKEGVFSELSIYKVNKYFICLWIIILTSTLFSIYPRLSVEFLRDYLVTTVLYIALIIFFNSFRDFQRIAFVMLLSTLTLSVPMFLTGISTTRTSVGSFYDPNDLAMFIACCLPFVLYLSQNGKKTIKIASTAALLLGLMAIISTQSRMGFLSLIIISFFYLFLGVSKKRHFFKKLIGFGCIAAIFLSVADPFYWDRIKTTFESGQTGSGRTVVWKRGLKIAAKYPVLGVGPGAFTSAYGRMLKAGKFELVGMVYDRAWKAGHNSYLKILVEFGIAGLIIFIFIIIFSIKQIINIRRKHMLLNDGFHIASMANALLMSIAIFAFCGFFLSHGTSPLFMTLIAISVLIQKIDNKGVDKIEH